MNSIRLTYLAPAIAFAALAQADTNGPWRNPLLQDVPATAKGLVSIDLGSNSKPLSTVLSLVQNATGKTIGENLGKALQLLNLPEEVSKEFAGATDKRAVVYFATGNFSSLQKGMVLVLGLKPGQKMSSVVKESVHDQDGIVYADFHGVNAHVEGNALYLTQDSKNFPLAVSTARGGPHISSATLARVSDAIEPSAEILAWMDSDTTTSTTAGNSFTVGTGKSFGLSVALHPKGISLSVGPVAISQNGKAFDLSSAKPLPANYLNTLPGGAYLVTCMSNPWPVAEHFKLLDNLSPDVSSTVDQIKGLVRGNYVIGLYPSQLSGGKPKGIDLLLELRPNEGNDPAHQLNLVMKSVAKMFLPGDEIVFQKFHVDGADHAYRLSHALASLLRMGLHSALQSVGGSSLDGLIKNKNVVFANVGSNIVVATSESVLRKAVAALKYGRSPLAADPKYSELARDANRPTQFVLAASLTRTLDFALGVMKEIKKDGKAVMNDEQFGPFIGALKSWPDPLMLRLSIIHDGISGRVFIPIAYDELGKAIGGKM